MQTTTTTPTLLLLLPLTLLTAAAVTNAFLLDDILWGTTTSRNRPGTTEATPDQQLNDTYPPDVQTSTSSYDNFLTENTTQVPDNATEDNNAITTLTTEYTPENDTSTDSVNNATPTTTEYTPENDTSTDSVRPSDSVTESSVHWPTLTSPGYATDCDKTATSPQDVFATATTAPPPSDSTPYETTRVGGMNPCQFTGPEMEQIQMVYNFTQTTDFRLLSENQQLFVYEVLASAEGCQLSQFLTVPAVQRFLLLTQDLPLKFVNKFIVFLFKSLAAEGIRVPV